jgi:hypothetical protein
MNPGNPRETEREVRIIISPAYQAPRTSMKFAEVIRQTAASSTTHATTSK